MADRRLTSTPTITVDESVADELKFHLVSDFPAESDVRDAVDYDNGAQTGNLVLPTVGQVQAGVGFGSNANQFTGTLPAGDPPSQNHVRLGVVYDNATKTGNLVLPAAAQVQEGVGFGTSGTQFTGSFLGGGVTFIQDADPGAVGAGAIWITLDHSQIGIRNVGDTDWDFISILGSDVVYVIDNAGARITDIADASTTL